jgi:DNA-binding transcriptional LysR family regulator
MELRHLRYFVAVAEELNFSRAARRLHVSQPPLSRQIKDLESELGVQLFQRRQNRIVLTRAGQLVYEHAQRLLVQSEQLTRAARALAESTRQELRIGYIANVHAELVIESATRFRKLHPKATVRLFDSTTAEQVAAIVAGKMDLGFVGFGDAPAKQGLHLERIGSTYATMALAKGHRLARPSCLPLRAFKDEPFVTINEQAFPGARQYVLSFCQAAGFQPRIVHEALQPIDVLNLVAIGEGVALIPQRMRQASHPGVVFRKLSEPVPRIDSYLAWRPDNDSELLLDFVRVAKEAYADSERSFSTGAGKMTC